MSDLYEIGYVNAYRTESGKLRISSYPKNTFTEALESKPDYTKSKYLATCQISMGVVELEDYNSPYWRGNRIGYKKGVLVGTLLSLAITGLTLITIGVV